MIFAGYRSYFYWEFKEFNRILTHRINNTSGVPDIISRDKDTFLFSGPYLRATVGF